MQLVRIGHPARLVPHVLKFSTDALLANSDIAAILQDIRLDIEKAIVSSYIPHVHVCTCTYVYNIYVYTCTYTGVHVHVYIHVHLHVRIIIHVYYVECTCICTCTCFESP